MKRPRHPFVDGMTAPLEGARFLWRHRELWKLAVVPFIINVILYALLMGALLLSLPFLLQRILPPESTWYWTLLAILLGVLAVALFLLVCFFTFTVVGCALGGPFSMKPCLNAQSSCSADPPRTTAQLRSPWCSGCSDPSARRRRNW